MPPRLAALVLCLVCAVPAYAQTATLRGFVSDASTGQALELVNVVIAPVEGGTARGGITSREGTYVLPGVRPGRYLLQASFIGYEAYRDTLALSPGEVRTLNVSLRPEAEALEEVLVQDERPDGPAGITAGQQTIRPAEIESVPAPGLSADLAGYLTTLPSVVTLGDRGGQLFIRGGEPSQNLVLLDGMVVYQPFHLLGFYSAFPAEVLKAADVYAGGFGARFGGRLSSVLDVSTREGNDRTYTGTVSVSPFVSALHVEGPIVPGVASLLVSGRRSFLEEGAQRLVSTPLPFAFGDALARLHVKPSPGTRLSATALTTFDRGVIAEAAEAGPADEIRWRNDGFSGRYLALPKASPFVGDVRVAYSRLRSEQGPAGAPERSSAVRDLRITATGTFYVGSNVATEAGMEVIALRFQNVLGGAFQDLVIDDTGFQNAAAFVEPEFTIPGTGLRIRTGLRFPVYRLDAFPRIEPRLRVVYGRGPHQLSLAAGLYQQEIVGVSDRRDAASVFTAWAYVKGVGARDEDLTGGHLARSVHTVLGYRTTPRRGLDLSLEAYHKSASEIYVAEWTAFPRLTTKLQPARGRSYGVDARLSVAVRRVQGHLTYGYSNTRYEAYRARYRLWYGSESLRFRPPHDRRHQVNARLQASAGGFDLSASWYFGSGLPFSRVLGFGGFVLLDDPGVDVLQGGRQRVIYERPFNGILPTFHRLDVALERTFSLRSVDVTLQASAINLYDRRNVFYLDVFTLRRSDQLPFVPSFGLQVDLP